MRDAEDDTNQQQAGTGNRLSWMKWISDLREYDVKYHVRIAIDLDVYVGGWYEIHAEHGDVRMVQCDSSKYMNPVPKICAFDIETTKAPLKFPQPEFDQIYMISYMLDTRGFLIVNREIVTEDSTKAPLRPSTKQMSSVFSAASLTR